MAASTAFYGTIRTAKAFMSVLIDIDSKLVSIQKVTGEGTDIAKIFERATLSAEKFGQSISKALDAYVEFSRQGYKGDDLGTLADSGLVASNVGEISAQQASEYMTASLVQWQMDSKKSMSIIDSWNEIANNFATTVEKLARGQSRAGATARAMGLDFDQLNAIIGTVTASTKQSGDEVGNFVKNVLPRLIGKPAQSALNSIGVSLTDSNGNFRDVIEVYTEVAKKIQNISDTERIAVVEGLAGKFHISRMQALLNDLAKADSMYQSMYNSSKNSAGSALRENEVYMQSLEARISLLKVEFEKLAVAIGEAFLTDSMIAFINGASSMLTLFSSIVGTFGVLPPALGVLGAALLMVSNRFRMFTTALIDNRKGAVETRRRSRDLATDIRSVDTAAQAGSKGMNLLSKSLKTLAMGFGVGIALSAIGFAVEKVIGSFGNARKKSEELASANKQLMDSYSANANDIDNLAERYYELGKSVEGWNNPDNTKLAEYRDIQNQIGDLMPSLVTGEDQYGQKIVGSSEALKIKIDLLKEQLAIEKQKTEQEERNSRNDKISNYESEINDAEKNIQRKIQIYKNNAKNSYRIYRPAQDVAIDFEKMDLSSPQKLIDKLEEIKKKRSELNEDTADSSTIGYYDSLINGMENTLKLIDGSLTSQKENTSYLKSNYISAIEETITKNTELSASLKESASALSAQLITAADTSNIQALEDALTSLGSNLESADIYKTVKDIFDSVENATSDTFDTASENARKSIDALQISLKGLKMEDKDIEVVMAALQGRLSSTIAEQVKYKDEMEKTNESLAVTRANVMAASDGYTEIDDATQGATSSFKDFKNINEELVGVSQEQIDYVNNLILKYEKFNSVLLGQEEAELAALATKGKLTKSESELVSAYNSRNAVMQEMESLYPNLLSNDGKAIELSGEKLEAMIKENEANQTLLDAYKLASEGKLTEEQKMTLFSAQETKTRIDHIKSEILALENLMQAYQESLTRIATAIDKMSDSKNTQASLELEMQYHRVASGVEALSNSSGLSNKISLLNDLQGQLDTSVGKISNFTSAVDKSNKSTKETGKESLYITDKFKQKLEEINLEIERQEKLQAKLPKHSQEYLKSLQTQLRYEKEKLQLFKDQAASLENQIRTGRIQQTGNITNNSSTSTATTTGNLSGWKGTKTSGFGSPTIGGSHRGIDIANKKGTRLDANVSGKVIASGDAVKNGYDKSYGNIVVIQDTNGLKHLYAHLEKSIAELGSTISAGTQIGTIGNTGTVRSSKGGDGSHLHYEVSKNGKLIDPSGYIRDAQNGKYTISESSSTSPSSVSTSQEAIDKAKSDLVGLHGQILTQEQAIDTLETRIINVPLAAYEYRRKVVQDNLDFEAEKIKSVDKSSTRYVKTLDLQRLYLERKQKINNEELEYLSKLISSGTISGDVLDEHKDRLIALKTEMMATSNAMSELALSMLDVYDFQRIEPSNVLEYERVKLQEVDTNSNRYVKTLDRMIASMKEKQRVNQNELNYLKEQITSGKHSGETLEKLKARYAALTTEMKQLGIELKNMNYDIVINISTQYDEKMDNIEYEIERSKIIQSMYDEGSADAFKEVHFQIERTNKLREEALKKIADLQQSLLQYELNPDKVKELNKELQQTSLKYQQLGLDILNMNKSIEDTKKSKAEEVANKLIAAYKEYVQERRDEHMKMLDDEVKRENDRHQAVMDNYKKELETFRKFADEKMDALDRESATRSYNQDIDEMEKERSELVRRINLLSMDDSHEATAKRKDLQTQLDKIDKDIANKRYDRDVELQKQALSDSVKAKEEEVNAKEELEDKRHDKEIDRIDELKKYWEQHYTDLANDERKFSEIRRAVVSGDFELLKKEFGGYIDELEKTMPNLANTLDGTMKAVGMSVRQNIIDALDEALTKMNELSNASVITGSHGSSNDYTGGASSSSNLSLGNMQVLLGKYLTDVLRPNASSDAEKTALANTAHSIANQGRNNGSEYSKDAGFYELFASLSNADKAKLGEFFMQNAGSVVSSSILQDIIRNYANQIGAGTGNYVPPSAQVPPTSNGNQSSNATLPQGDKQVLMAKYMKDVLMYKTNDTSARLALSSTADKIAQAGRQNNSSISSSVDFDVAIANYSKSQMRSLGEFMQANAGSISNSSLQNILLSYARQLASLDTGGMTKNWGAFGGVDGKGARFGLLHPEEIVNNPLDSKRLLGMANVLERAVTFISPAISQLANFSRLSPIGGDHYSVTFGDVLNATQSQAENFASSFVNSVRVKKGGK